MAKRDGGKTLVVKMEGDKHLLIVMVGNQDLMATGMGGAVSKTSQVERTDTMAVVAGGEEPFLLVVVPGRLGAPQTTPEVKGRIHISTTAGINRESVLWVTESWRD